MFWRSVVGKLALTILLLVSFVLFILTILLLEFFESFHVQEAEKGLMRTATIVSSMIEDEDHDHDETIMDTIERVKDPSSRIFIIMEEEIITSESTNAELSELSDHWFKNEEEVHEVLTDNKPINKQIKLPNDETEVMIVGTPVDHGNGAVFVYQSLDVIDQTRAHTTRIIFLAAGIAIILTTIFAFFLSTRITAPLIKMREAAFDLTRGEFNTKVPIVSHDEIGELGIAFNKMGSQLKFHINALRQEKEQLSGIVSSMADGVITLNRNGDMILTNPPADKFIEDWFFVNNINLEDQAEQKLPNELHDILQKVIQGEKEVLQEISLQGRNLVMIMTPLHDQSYVRGAVAVMRDMTEERRLDKLRKDFISNVSHELRTPISLLQGYSEAIVDDIAESKEDKNELAKIINEESLRMGRLVNELLDLERMDTGNTPFHHDRVNLNQFMNRIIKKFSGSASEENITITLNKDLINETAIFDADQLEQVFTNLIDNALTHTPENGEITILVKNRSEQLYVEIADDGNGIPEEDLPFIFERFYKADKSRTRNANKKGTGLGLSIVKNIIDKHDGTIAVKSKLNAGTTFSFKIKHKKES